MTVSCQSTTELFSEYYDGGLRAEERRALEDHLKTCASCTVEFKHYTESLGALQKTRSIETSQLFLTNVKAAAAAHLQKRESYLRTQGVGGDSQSMTVVTPKADGSETVPLETAAPSPWPLRGALAAVLLAGFALGYFVFGGRKSDPAPDRLHALLEAELKKRPKERVVVKEPVDEEQVLRARGLVKVDGQWVPKRMDDDFKRGLVCLGGRMMTREDAAKLLAKEFPPAAPPVPLPPPAPDPDKLVEETLAKAGYRKVNDVLIPEAWLAKWGEGLVQVGVNEWKKAADFKEELIREHNLVEVRGKLMTREQAEALKAQELVRPPDAATAVNELTRALAGLQIGPPMNYRGITVYPLMAPGDLAPAGVVPLHAAQGQGKLELTDAQFFAAQVKNGLEEDVLFLAGEVLAGGRCARIVAEDTLVARGQAGKVPVFCAEPGAWRGTEQFAKESGHYVAPPSLRRALAAEQGQGAVWSLLAKRVDKTRPGLVDLFRKHAEAVSDIRAYFTVLPDREPTAVGAAVAIGNALEFVELFQDHSLFAAYFDRLLMGAALDALDRAVETPVSRGVPALPNSVRGVKQFLEGAFFWTYEAREDGYGMRKDDAWVGRARIVGGTLVHAQLYSPRAPEWDRRTAAPVPKEKMAKVIADYESRMKTLGPARKVAVLHDLASIASPEVTVVLVRHLNETDTTIRRAVVQELGASGDVRAYEPLAQVLARSRAEPALFAEAVRALCRLGDERAVEPLLQQLDAAEGEPARVVLSGLPELLLQVRNRELLARATARMVVLFEAAEGVSKGELGLDPVTKNMRPAEAEALSQAVRTALTQLVGIEFQTSAGCRKWWNDRETRERFLKERTGK